MELNRRRYLAVAGAMVGGGLAGCSSIAGGGGGPEYESDQKEEMLLSVDAFPGGWVRNDEITITSTPGSPMKMSRLSFSPVSRYLTKFPERKTA